jgi:hypothetical protein
MLTVQKTPAAADALGVTYYRLIGQLRSRGIRAPAKDTTGDLVWTAEDSSRAPCSASARLATVADRAWSDGPP